MTRYIFIVLGILVLGYWGYTSWTESREADRQLAITDAQATHRKKAVLQRAASVNARVDWPTRLAQGEKARLSPVLTAELQQLWLAGQPILFVGRVTDVARSSTSTFTVSAEYEGTLHPPLFLSTEIRVVLECPERFAAPLVQALSRPDRFSFAPDVALFGNIDQVTQATVTESDGSSESVLTGHGVCIDAVHLPEPINW